MLSAWGDIISIGAGWHIVRPRCRPELTFGDFSLAQAQDALNRLQEYHDLGQDISKGFFEVSPSRHLNKIWAKADLGIVTQAYNSKGKEWGVSRICNSIGYTIEGTFETACVRLEASHLWK